MSSVQRPFGHTRDSLLGAPAHVVCRAYNDDPVKVTALLPESWKLGTGLMAAAIAGPDFDTVVSSVERLFRGVHPTVAEVAYEVFWNVQRISAPASSYALAAVVVGAYNSGVSVTNV